MHSKNAKIDISKIDPLPMSKRTAAGKSKESLVDRVMRAAPTAKKIVSRPGERTGDVLRVEPTQAAALGPKYITLQEWATSMFGNKAPHYNTLLRWVHEGRIQPQPKKMGRRYWLVRDAKYEGDEGG